MGRHYCWPQKCRVVTVIEVLSPANKTRHRDRYIANRDAILSSDSHLVEIDLLRGDLYEFGLRDRLPVNMSNEDRSWVEMIVLGKK